jgi:lipoyl(octanoyl) transferase
MRRIIELSELSSGGQFRIEWERRVILFSMDRIWSVLHLGMRPYEEVWELQGCLAEAIARGEHPPALLLCEHPHTYTFGRRGQAKNLLWDEAERQRRGIAVHWVDRGGDITYHGPGQLVGYPLLPLGRPVVRPVTGEGSVEHFPRLPQADYVGYIRRLEEMLILALMKLGLVSGQIEGLTGVWVQPDVLSRCRACPPNLRQQPAKIAAIGVKVDARGITRHGFALNVNPDMTYWEGIISCGLEGAAAISLAELLDPPPEMEVVSQVVCGAFEHVFGCQLVESGTEPARSGC